MLHFSCWQFYCQSAETAPDFISQITDGKDETWSPAEMSVARRWPWSPAAAHSKPLPWQRGRHDRRWSCATTVEHAATVTMQIADTYVTRCRRPTVVHCRDNVVLCCSYNGKLKRRGRSRSALGRAASGAHEEEETCAHSSLPSTWDGRQNLRRTVQCESRKVAPLKLFAIFSLRLSILSWNFADLLPVYIHTCLPILVDFSDGTIQP